MVMTKGAVVAEKYRNLRRNPKIVLSITDLENPYR
jgi:hypothetical protein